MALYQGEDIGISFSGEGVLNLENSKFVVLLYSENNSNEKYVISGEDFTKVNNQYVYNIDHNTTKNMKGLYSIEILVEDNSTVPKRSIFKKEGALFIEFSKVWEQTPTSPNN